MTRPFDVRLPPEQAYSREAMLAVELLDPVTLERISHGVKVTAVGLTSTPIANFSGRHRKSHRFPSRRTARNGATARRTRQRAADLP